MLQIHVHKTTGVESSHANARLSHIRVLPKWCATTSWVHPWYHIVCPPFGTDLVLPGGPPTLIYSLHGPRRTSALVQHTGSVHMDALRSPNAHLVLHCGPARVHCGCTTSLCASSTSPATHAGPPNDHVRFSCVSSNCCNKTTHLFFPLAQADHMGRQI
ncbi:hypothetical protein AMTR_s00086p00078430 [Amborella trichopoda]|uniref:Uncharacterized protein n=1 Tax=Amborella trichopoda TaxID=13333 RepID=W1P5D0_AMBTC|nr:hypothetical protein AMTR_s00086p00078430 [Amborella trichopoda]